MLLDYYKLLFDYGPVITILVMIGMLAILINTSFIALGWLGAMAWSIIDESSLGDNLLSKWYLNLRVTLFKKDSDSLELIPLGSNFPKDHPLKNRIYEGYIRPGNGYDDEYALFNHRLNQFHHWTSKETKVICNNSNYYHKKRFMNNKMEKLQEVNGDLTLVLDALKVFIATTLIATWYYYSGISLLVVLSIAGSLLAARMARRAQKKVMIVLDKIQEKTDESSE